jgi:transposase
MQTTAAPPDSHALDMAQLRDVIERQASEIVQLRTQLDWFKRQIFGQKSEKRHLAPGGEQGILGEGFADGSALPAPGKKTRIGAHERSKTSRDFAGDETNLFFDDKRVPVEVIEVSNPEIDGIAPDQVEIIGEKVSHRLAQRPGSYVILKYVRKVIKRRNTQALSCPAAPMGVIDGSRADVSFLAGLLIDKFCYHLPLYRQHQRLAAAGIKVSRPWLTQIGQGAIALLEPIFEAMLASIKNSRVIKMDETPIKAGPAGAGKMKTGQMWPVMGQEDEICFLFHPGRSTEYVYTILGDKPPDGAVLQTDGYCVYARYAQRTGIAHAQCWAHCRREIFEARHIEPERAEQALQAIAGLYAVEAEIRAGNLAGQARRALRQAKARPIAERFFAWVDAQFDGQGFLPSSPFIKALAYARERREGLMLYLNHPEVDIDTNDLERALRVIPMGRKNWLFCWTELGARQVGIMQSLLVTCKLQGIDPYDYLVDVLQRIGQHPASKVHELTPRMWKQLFAENPLRSPLHQTATSA